ncbi:MAG: MarR family transcriptional regulator [Mycobacteriales bacterium]
MQDDVDIGILIGLAWESFVRELHVDLAQRGFEDAGTSYGYVLRSLADRQLSISELAALLGVTSQAVTRLINEMSANGYTERRLDSRDARVSSVALTAKGRSALAAARRFHGRFERSLVKRHGPDDVITLRAVLTSAVEASPGGPAGRRAIRPF